MEQEQGVQKTVRDNGYGNINSGRGEVWNTAATNTSSCVLSDDVVKRVWSYGNGSDHQRPTELLAYSYREKRISADQSHLARNEERKWNEVEETSGPKQG